MCDETVLSKTDIENIIAGLTEENDLYKIFHSNDPDAETEQVRTLPF